MTTKSTNCRLERLNRSLRIAGFPSVDDSLCKQCSAHKNKISMVVNIADKLASQKSITSTYTNGLITMATFIERMLRCYCEHKDIQIIDRTQWVVRKLSTWSKSCKISKSQVKRVINKLVELDILIKKQDKSSITESAYLRLNQERLNQILKGNNSNQNCPYYTNKPLKNEPQKYIKNKAVTPNKINKLNKMSSISIKKVSYIQEVGPVPNSKSNINNNNIYTNTVSNNIYTNTKYNIYTKKVCNTSFAFAKKIHNTSYKKSINPNLVENNPVLHNKTKIDYNSKEYTNMLSNLCYFKVCTGMSNMYDLFKSINAPMKTIVDYKVNDPKTKYKHYMWILEQADIIIAYWNTLPGVRKHRNPLTQIYQRTRMFIQLFIKGDMKYKGFDKEFMGRICMNKKFLSNGFTPEQIKEALTECVKQYTPIIYTHGKSRIKDISEVNLCDILFNPKRKSSYFLEMVFKLNRTKWSVTDEEILPNKKRKRKNKVSTIKLLNKQNRIKRKLPNKLKDIIDGYRDINKTFVDVGLPKITLNEYLYDEDINKELVYIKDCNYIDLDTVDGRCISVRVEEDGKDGKITYDDKVRLGMEERRFNRNNEIIKEKCLERNRYKARGEISYKKYKEEQAVKNKIFEEQRQIKKEKDEIKVIERRLKELPAMKGKFETKILRKRYDYNDHDFYVRIEPINQ